VRADRDVPRHPRTRSRNPANARQPGGVKRHIMTISRLAASRMRRRHQQGRPPETGLLESLAAELGRAWIRAEPLPDKTALLVYRAGAPLPLWVFVGDDGASFCWDSGYSYHPVTDVAGAAKALAAFLRVSCPGDKPLTVGPEPHA
jgi:hypothetical protein